MKKIYLILFLFVVTVTANGQTSDELINDFVVKAKEYNDDFQKELNSFVKSIEKSDVVKKKSFSIGFGTDMIVDFNNQFMVKINFYNRELVNKSFKKKDELVIFLKAFTK